MSGCGLDESCADMLAKILGRLRNLKVLDLGHNHLGTAGVSLVIERINAPLKKFILAANGAGDGAGRAIVAYLCYNRNPIDKFDISRNRFGDGFALLLARQLNRIHVRDILLGYNDVTTIGARALQQSLGPNTPHVYSIDLRLNFVDPSALADPTESGVPDTDTVDSMDYTRVELHRRMEARLRALEAKGEKQREKPRVKAERDTLGIAPAANSPNAQAASLAKRMEALREATRQLRAAKVAKIEAERPMYSAGQLIEELRRKTGIDLQ